MAPLRIDLGHEPFTPLFISPDSQKLFARPWCGGTLKVFSLLTVAAPEVIEDPEHAIRDAAILVPQQSDGSRGDEAAQGLLVLLDGGRVKLVDLRTYKPVDVDLLNVGRGAQRLAASRDGTRMAVAYSPRPVVVFDLRTRTQLRELTAGPRWRNGADRIRFSPDGSYLVAEGENLLAVWNEHGKLVKDVDTEGPNGSRSLWTDMAVTPDSTGLVWLQNSYIGGDTVASCDYLVRAQRLDVELLPPNDVAWETRKDAREWRFTGKWPAAPTAVDVSPDGRRVIVAGDLPEFEGASVICEWSMEAPSGLIQNHPSFSKIAEVPGLVGFARVAPDGDKIVVVAKQTVGRDSASKQHLFISVYEYAKRNLL